MRCWTVASTASDAELFFGYNLSFCYLSSSVERSFFALFTMFGAPTLRFFPLGAYPVGGLGLPHPTARPE